MQGTHRPGYRKPRATEKRKVRQPFLIDKLSEEVRTEIQKRRAAGETWQEISEASEKFAGRVLPASMLHAWHGVRVEQVNAEVMARAEMAQQLAAAFAGKGFEKLDEAVQNSFASLVFSLAEHQDDASRAQLIKAMGDLDSSLVQWRKRDQEDRRLDQEDKRIDLKSKALDMIAAKSKALKGGMQGKKKLSPEELKRKIDEIYGIASEAA